jgi:hypothetical protein
MGVVSILLSGFPAGFEIAQKVTPALSFSNSSIERGLEIFSGWLPGTLSPGINFIFQL